MIEAATLEDVEAMTELWVALAKSQRSHGSHVLGGESETAVRQTLGERVFEDRAFVAREDGSLVGFVTVGVEEGSYARDVTRGVVENVFVESAFRGRGVGTALMERAERALRSRDVDVVSLEVLADNVAARQLYERLGYREHRIELEKSLGSDNH